jgi:ABC-type Mn2+/Zn2+ transport system permease subunit
MVAVALSAFGIASLTFAREFIDSWDLFRFSYLEGWLVALVLSIVGVLVVARDQIFIGAAVSQASTVGIALALLGAGLLKGHSDHPVTLTHSDSLLHSDTSQAVMAVVFSIVAALITARGGRIKRESYEAITGWVFLVSTSLSVLLLAHSPHGLEEIHRIHSSSIIGATPLDVVLFAVFAAVTIVFLALTHDRLLLFAMDPSMAAAVGMRIGLWAAGVAVWIGLAIGLCIRATGMLYTFGMLVLPALVAKNLCREVRPMFWVSPAIALGSATAGFVLANHYDFPPGQMTVAVVGFLLVVAWTGRGLLRK